MLALALLASSVLNLPAWMHVAARGEWIPAFVAAVVNTSGIDGVARVQLAGETPMPEDLQPSFVVLAFRLEDEAGNVNTHLEGILEHRQRGETDLETRCLYWSDGGERVRLEGMEDYGVYCFRVRPGEMGIAGFLLNRDPHSEGPLTRFLRFYQVAPGKDAWLGAFGVKQGPGQLVSVTMEAKPEIVEKLRQVRQRAVEAAPARRPRSSSNLTLGK